MIDTLDVGFNCAHLAIPCARRLPGDTFTWTAACIAMAETAKLKWLPRKVARLLQRRLKLAQARITAGVAPAPKPAKGRR